jgi:hypothetical protein
MSEEHCRDIDIDRGSEGDENSDRGGEGAESQFKTALLNLTADVASGRNRADTLYTSLQRIESKVRIAPGIDWEIEW